MKEITREDLRYILEIDRGLSEGRFQFDTKRVKKIDPELAALLVERKKAYIKMTEKVGKYLIKNYQEAVKKLT